MWHATFITAKTKYNPAKVSLLNCRVFQSAIKLFESVCVRVCLIVLVLVVVAVAVVAKCKKKWCKVRIVLPVPVYSVCLCICAPRLLFVCLGSGGVEKRGERG